MKKTQTKRQIQIHALYDFTTHWRKPGFFFLAQDVYTAGDSRIFEAPSQSQSAIMARDGSVQYNSIFVQL